MSIQALTGAFVQVSAAMGATAAGGVVVPTGTLTTPTDISAWVAALEVGGDVDTKDVTSFGSAAYQAMVASLRKGTCNLTLMNDYAAGGPNALLGFNGSVIAFGATGFIETRAVNAVRSASNPGFVAKIINVGWRSLNAAVGEVPMVTWNPVPTGWFTELIA